MLAALPDYARDLRLNLGNLLKQPELTARQAWGTAVAAAIASRNTTLTRVVTDEAVANGLDPEALKGARAAAAIMAMNNVYYRFLHLTPNEAYSTIPARLRMQVIRTHGTDPVDFELWCTAVSAINNCRDCVAAHEKNVIEKGMKPETVLASVRIAAVIHAVATVLDAEGGSA